MDACFVCHEVHLQHMNAMLLVRPAPGWSVTCAAGQRVPVQGISDALFSLANGQRLLQKVLLVPSISTSLLSISALASVHCFKVAVALYTITTSYC
jgi:hypothetical protein